MNKLKDKVALVTGGNSGIGLATAKLFAKEGASVIISGRNQDTLNAAVKEIGGDVVAVKADVSVLSDIDHLYHEIKRHHSNVDIIFANAGIAPFFPASAATEENYDEVVDINVKGVYFTIQKAIPYLRTGGAIVINASSAWMKGVPNGTVYAATKASVRSYARTFAAEFLDQKIRVNVISPGPIQTPIFNDTPQELSDFFKNIVPMKRFGTAEEIANAVLFLASDDSSYITGVDIPVDGGLTML